MKNRKTVGVIFLIAGLLLLLGAGGFVTYNVWDANRARISAGKALQEVTAAMHARSSDVITERNGKPVIEFEVELQHPGQETRTEAEEAEQQKNMTETVPSTSVTYGVTEQYAGILELPTLGLTLPVGQNWSYDLLKAYPCRYTGSLEIGSLIICGHNYKTHFGSLPSLKIGDKVYFTDMNQIRHTFVVELIETLDMDAVEAMQDTDWPLSLFTCTLSRAARYTVRLSQES